MALRTPTEVAFGVELPLDMEDLFLGDYEHQDRTDAAREARLLADAVAMGDHLAAQDRAPWWAE